MMTTDAQGQMVFKLSGTIYSHDSATSDVFVVAAQPGAKDYRNALRGFRHGIDKIDLRQTGVTDFSQLAITKSNRGTINGLSQIHGVDVTFNGANGIDSNVKLLYLDTLDISQVDANDFLFAEYMPDLVPTVGPVVTQESDKPIVASPDGFTPVTIPEWKPITIPPIEWEPITIPPVKWEPVTIPERELISTDPDDPNFITVKKTFGEITLGDESKTINVKAVGVTMVAGNGDNTVNVAESMSDITLGNGNNDIVGNVEKLTVGHGDNKINATGRDANITLGDGNSIITGNVGELAVGHGDNKINVTGWGANITLGDGNSIITGNINKLIAGHGDNKIESSSDMSTVEVGNGKNHIVASGSMSKVAVGNGNNHIETSGSMAKVKVGDGNNHIMTSGTMSTVEVGHGDNDLRFSGRTGNLVFGKDIAPAHLWFQHEGQDLQISVIGSKQEVTLHNWYATSPERPSSITAGDGYRLMDRSVENLVQAMAAFAPPTSASTTFGDIEKQQLQSVLAVNWRAPQ